MQHEGNDFAILLSKNPMCSLWHTNYVLISRMMLLMSLHWAHRGCWGHWSIPGHGWYLEKVEVWIWLKGVLRKEALHIEIDNYYQTYEPTSLGDVLYREIPVHWTGFHPVDAIWSYNERWYFSRPGSSLFVSRFSVLTFLRLLGPFFIFSEIFTK